MKTKKANRIKNFFKSLTYRHYVSVGLTVCFILLAIFVYNKSFIRLFESINDIYTSCKYYIAELFFDNSADVIATVIERSNIPFGKIFPLSAEDFELYFSVFWDLLFTSENLFDYLQYSSKFLLILNVLLTFLVILFIVLRLYFGMLLKTPNDNMNVDTKPLKVYKKIEAFIKTIKDWLCRLFAFFKQKKFVTLWVWIWLFNLNVISIIIEVFAYLFYFVASFDVLHLYMQLYKLVCDLAIMFSGLPWYIWVTLAIIALNWFRHKKGYDKLTHMEAYDTGFARSLGIATMITAPMNGNKTKLATDLSLTFSKIFKYDCRETMRKCESQFKNFSFSSLNADLQDKINKHEIFSLATVEERIRGLRRNFFAALNSGDGDPRQFIYGYDYTKHSFVYDNKLYLVDLFEMLEEYSKAYFIYSMPDSFIVSNYAIREDGKESESANLSLWNYDYFKRDSFELSDISYYSKILDFDILRKGKTVIENNPLSDTFEFGVVTITEFDKDRGNQLDTKGLKRESGEANQLNDLFNYSPKMGRHSSTIDFTPYVRYIFDLQRAMKTEADIREICDCVLNVQKKDGGHLALPLFFIEEFLNGLICDRYATFLDEYDFYHSDNTLLGYLAKSFFGRFLNYYRNTYNLYGYDVLKIDIQNGQLESCNNLHNYFITYKKAHLDRYATDCYGWFFRDEALKKDKGIVDYPSFAGSKATRDELRLENSYFIRALERVTDSRKDKK